MGKRQEAAVETRSKIIAAVKKLLREKSADSINIEDITTAAGVAKGSFYTYFKRKEDVICVIALEEYAVIGEEILSSDEGVYDRLCSYLMQSVKLIDQNTLQIAQNWIKSAVAPLKGESCGEYKYSFDLCHITKILEGGVESGELKEDAPVGKLAQLIMNCYYGAVAGWCITGGGEDLIRAMKNFCETGLRIVINNYLKGECLWK
ncbi:TetR/AcrR family transcriptional regulator [Ruminococcus sp. Marseille-P6503]|uniref:TetR/AcrR family transcriptional regulator n=1 Tax=Ruminococcus sp. Marseille-P6503 TaxID=2364796 RepID=UPI000F529AA5|nr:TetR/AcrR family transcriptional regulator [Ruminococcus sp. Marseille-P6503]